MKIIIKQSNGEQFDVEVDNAANVLQLKEAVKEAKQLEIDQIRLIFKGTQLIAKILINLYRSYLEGRYFS